MFEIAQTVYLFLPLNQQKVELADASLKAARAVSDATIGVDKLDMLTPHAFEIQGSSLRDDQCVKARK
jgi:hypothetical protein